MKMTRLLNLLSLSFALAAARLEAQIYPVGSVVSDFTLTNRATGQPIRLSDYAGKIVLIEWFAHWCPFCRAAAPEIETEIVEYYQTRGGTAEGVPVVKLGVNIQADTGSNRASTDAFAAAYGFTAVGNDTSRKLQGRFTSTSGQPSFAIISGLPAATDRTTGKVIQQWELLYSRFGYGATTQPITAFRTAIDRVKMTTPATPVRLEAPTRGPANQLSLLITGTPRAGLTLQSSEDGALWSPFAQPVPTDPAAPVLIPTEGGQRLFRVIRSTAQ